MSDKATKWLVAAACVVVQLFGEDRYLYKGAVLPDGVPAADITRLSNTGLIVEVSDVDAEKVKAVQADVDAQEKADAAASAGTEGATDAGAAKAASGRAPAAKTVK